MSDIKLGVQLFTLRDKCKTAEDFEPTLKFLQSIGCDVIQISAIKCVIEDNYQFREIGRLDTYINTEEKLQKITDEYVKKIDEICAAKSAEILEI